MERVVITGMGVIPPLGNDVHTFWNGLTERRSGVSPIEHFDTASYKTRIAGVVRDFDGEERFGRKEARRMDRFVQFAVAAADQAVSQSG
ncbi:beta-ketoacyl-[acyl-carrier-protein] synthase II, partial [Clostridioides difficile]